MSADISFYKQTFLFSSLEDGEILNTINKSQPCIKTFEKGECIYTEAEYERKLGLIVEGCCEVKILHSDGTSLPLNTLYPYGTFGIIAALSDLIDYPSCVIAKKRTTVVFITSDDLKIIMRDNPSISLNVSKFLANRIVFLNQKVHTFSENSVEKKLANYLISRVRLSNEEEFEFNRKRTSELISAGRASLYRALDTLRERGYISYDSKKIYIKDRDGLERISQ